MLIFRLLLILSLSFPVFAVKSHNPINITTALQKDGDAAATLFVAVNTDIEMSDIKISIITPNYVTHVSGENTWQGTIAVGETTRINSQYSLANLVSNQTDPDGNGGTVLLKGHHYARDWVVHVSGRAAGIPYVNVARNSTLEIGIGEPAPSHSPEFKATAQEFPPL